MKSYLQLLWQAQEMEQLVGNGIGKVWSHSEVPTVFELTVQP